MKSVWIGLLAVSAPPNNQIIEGCPGAYVTAVTVAQDVDDFFKEVALFATELGLHLDEIIWSEPLDERLVKFDIDEYLLEFAKEVEVEGKGCRFGVFHAWEEQ